MPRWRCVLVACARAASRGTRALTPCLCIPAAQAFYAAVQQAGGDETASIVSDTPSLTSYGAPSSVPSAPWASSFPEAVPENASYAPSYASQPVYTGPAPPVPEPRVPANTAPGAYAVPVSHYEPSVAGSAAGSFAPSYAPSFVPSYAPSYVPSEVRPAAPPTRLCGPQETRNATACACGP